MSRYSVYANHSDIARFMAPHVTSFARSKERLLETAALVAQPGGTTTLVLSLDLREPESADTVVAKTLAEFGRKDALVNIAGAVPQIDLFDMEDAQWDSGFALKFHGARRLSIRAWESPMITSGSVILASGNSPLAAKALFAHGRSSGQCRGCDPGQGVL
ncbi:hypothetical protein ACHAQJ_001232 [Trichoderma viride]